MIKSRAPHSSTVSNPMLRRQLLRREQSDEEGQVRAKRKRFEQWRLDQKRTATHIPGDIEPGGGSIEAVEQPSVQPSAPISRAEPAGRVDKHEGARKRKKRRTVSDD